MRATRLFSVWVLTTVFALESATLNRALTSLVVLLACVQDRLATLLASLSSNSLPPAPRASVQFCEPALVLGEPQQPVIIDVPRPHFVFFGVGGVLPDFAGPFTVDAIYRNKAWGPQDSGETYFAVWTGYYENRKITIGTDADVTYGGICAYLAADTSFSVRHVVFRAARLLWFPLLAVNEVIELLAKQAIVKVERYVLPDTRAGELVGSMAYVWVHWALRWNLVWAISTLWRPRLRHASQRHRPSRISMPHTLLHRCISLVDLGGYILLMTPPDLVLLARWLASHSLAHRPVSLPAFSLELRLKRPSHGVNAC